MRFRSYFTAKTWILAFITGLLFIIIFENFVLWDFWEYYFNPSNNILSISASCFPWDGGYLTGFNLRNCIEGILLFFAFIFICLIISLIFWKTLEKIKLDS